MSPDGRMRSRAALPVPPAFVPLAPAAPVGLPTPDRDPPGGFIEVELADGHHLRAEADADPALVRDVLAALLER